MPRFFSNPIKRAALKRAAGHCECVWPEGRCNLPIRAGAMIYDHIIPYALSADSSLSNAQIICLGCDRIKTASADIPTIAKVKRIADAHSGITGPGLGSTPLPAGRASPISRTLIHGIVPRRSQIQKHRAYLLRRYGFLIEAEGEI